MDRTTSGRADQSPIEGIKAGPPPQDIRGRIAALRCEFPRWTITPHDTPPLYRAVRKSGKGERLGAGTYDSLRRLLVDHDKADGERATLLGTEIHPQLSALARHMGVRKYSVDIGSGEITVTTPIGVCPPRAVRVTCEPWAKDEGAAWFWTHWGDPIAPADRLTDAEVKLVGLLASEAAGSAES